MTSSPISKGYPGDSAVAGEACRGRSLSFWRHSGSPSPAERLPHDTCRKEGTLAGWSSQGGQRPEPARAFEQPGRNSGCRGDWKWPTWPGRSSTTGAEPWSDRQVMHVESGDDRTWPMIEVRVVAVPAQITWQQIDCGRMASGRSWPAPWQDRGAPEGAVRLGCCHHQGPLASVARATAA